jgi:hypothetical protein
MSFSPFISDTQKLTITLSLGVLNDDPLYAFESYEMEFMTKEERIAHHPPSSKVPR